MRRDVDECSRGHNNGGFWVRGKWLIIINIIIIVVCFGVGCDEIGAEEIEGEREPNKPFVELLPLANKVKAIRSFRT